jgi:hypothetical protein
VPCGLMESCAPRILLHNPRFPSGLGFFPDRSKFYHLGSCIGTGIPVYYVRYGIHNVQAWLKDKSKRRQHLDYVWKARVPIYIGKKKLSVLLGGWGGGESFKPK